MLYELFLPLGIFMWPHQSTKWHLKGPLATPKCYTLSSLIVYSCCYHGENVNWSRINSTWVTSSHHERNHVISPTQSILPYTVGKHNILHHRLTCMYCAAVVAVPMHELLHACCCPQQCYSIHFKLQCYSKFWRERYLQTSIWLILSSSQALLEGLLVDCSRQGKCAVYSFHAEHMECMQNYSSSQRMKILMTHFNLNRSSWSDT